MKLAAPNIAEQYPARENEPSAPASCVRESPLLSERHDWMPAPEPAIAALPILVVDDDPGIRKLIRAGLSDFGYAVELVESVSQAEECLRTRAYSLVLSDYDMPCKTGLELLAYVSQVAPDLPFIMLTAHDQTSLACRAISSGALDFLPKPFGIEELARRIEQNRTRLERDRARAAQLTETVLNGTVRALVSAVDAKDPYTACHSDRVTRLALRLGEALGLEAGRLRLLEFAAILHDVGKIGVPDSILGKPGKLDADEYAQIKLHPGRSAEIVGQVGEFTEVAGIVRHHHERVDGSGYPDGLAGEAIPLLARLIAIADVYEALTSDRSYRSALAEHEARAVLSGGLGVHFDPGLGEVFLSLKDLP